jgi:hypothetical protein
MQITEAGVKQLSQLPGLRELLWGIPFYTGASEAALQNPFVAPEILETPGWGEAVEGFQVRLRAPEATVRAGRIPRLLVDIANQGARQLQSTTNSWCWRWSGQFPTLDGRDIPAGGFSEEGALLDVLSGKPWANLPLVLSVAWRTADNHELAGRFGGGGVFYSAGFEPKPLRVSPGKNAAATGWPAVPTAPTSVRRQQPG